MKKTSLIISLTVITVSAFAQRTAEVLKTHEKIHIVISSNRALLDTLWNQYEDWVKPTLFVASNGNNAVGYVAGNNNFGDKHKAQVFPNTTNTAMKIEQVILLFGGKYLSSGNANSKVAVKTYAWNGTTPGSSTSAVDLLVNDIDTLAGSWNIVTFTNPATVGSDFGVGIDLTATASGDYVGLYSSEDGGGNVYGNLAWEQWNDNSWHLFSGAETWGHL